MQRPCMHTIFLVPALVPPPILFDSHTSVAPTHMTCFLTVPHLDALGPRHQAASSRALAGTHGAIPPLCLARIKIEPLLIFNPHSHDIIT
jgi:hypothetical protein